MGLLSVQCMTNNPIYESRMWYSTESLVLFKKRSISMLIMDILFSSFRTLELMRLEKNS